MKLSCTQENLNQGLFVTNHIASRNVNLPILSNVLLRAKDNILKLITTNLEVGITCVVRGKIEKEGEFTLQSKLLSDYISLLPNEKIDLELRDQNLEIKCKKHKTKIRGQDASEFPLIPKIEKNEPYIYKITDFVGAINQVVFAVSQSETRPEISGVFFNFKKNNLTLAATDSYRLTEKVIESKKSPKTEVAVIVPTKTLQELLRILSGLRRIRGGEEVSGESFEGSEDLEIYLSENQILFSFNNIELISRTIEGQYPNYKQIIPTESKTKAILDVSEFIKVVKTAGLFSKSGIFDISLEFLEKDKEVEISSVNNQLGETTSRLETEIEGETNKIVVNCRYLLDGLGNIGSEKVSFEMTNDANPCILRPILKEGEPIPGYLYIIMPIKQ